MLAVISGYRLHTHLFMATKAALRGAQTGRKEKKTVDIYLRGLGNVRLMGKNERERHCGTERQR